MSIEYDLKPHRLLRPPKVRWILDQQETALASIKSKSTRKFLTHANELLETAHIEYVFESVSPEQYATWHEYYTQKMIENNFEILAKLDWYNQKIQDGATIYGIFLYKEKVMIGSTIIHLANNTSSMAYKASDRVELTKDPNSSLGALIDYFYIEEMMKAKVETITSGRSRNAFGVINKLGYLDYKLKFGFYPTVESINDSLPTFLLNDEGYGVSFCHSLDNSDLTMIQICPQGDEHQLESSRFVGDHFGYQVITYEREHLP